MGCSVGRQGLITEQSTVTEFLYNSPSPDQLEMVRKTWKILSRDLRGTGVLLFRRLFSQNPELVKLFPKMTSQQDNGQLDLLPGPMERHAVNVMQAIETALDNFEDKKLLTGILQDLGHRHAKYGVLEHMFQKLWEATEYVFGLVLQDQMTPEVKESWLMVFQYLVRHIVSGMRDYQVSREL